MRRPGGHEADHLGDVGGEQWGHPPVDRLRTRLVAAESDEGELGLHHSRGDLGEAHRLSEEFAAQGLVQRRLRVFGRGVARAAVIDLERRDRRHRHDEPVAGCDQLGQQRPRHAQRAEHVGLPHPAPVVEVGVGDRLHALGAARVVDQDVDAVQAGRERVDRRAVSDVRHNCRAADLVGERAAIRSMRRATHTT